MTRTIAILSVILMVNMGFSQQHYYVSASVGSDGNSGTSLVSAWQSLHKACLTAAPGSTIHILPGVYHESMEVLASGTAAQPITFTGTPGQTIIDGTGSSLNYLLHVKNASYLHFENIVFQNLTGNQSNGIIVETTWTAAATALSFKNCTVRNISWTTDSSLHPLPSDNAHSFAVYGRTGGITDLTIDGCEIYGNQTGYSEALTLTGNVNGFSIKNCSVHDNSNIGIVISGHRGISSVNDEARNGIISNNVCYNNTSNHATSGGIYIDGGNSVIIERNTSHSNGYGIEIGAEANGVTYGIVVRNNVLYNNQGGGLEIGGYNPETTGEVHDCVIRNNTFFSNNTNNDWVGELRITKASNCTFQNNIFYTSDQKAMLSVEDIAPQSGNLFNFNCWYTPGGNADDIVVLWHNTVYTSYQNYRTATGQDQSSGFLNPGFELLSASPDLHLSVGSGCIDSGDMSTAVSNDEKDFDGNTRVVGTIIDKGAFESIVPLATEKQQFLNFNFSPNPANEMVKLRMAANNPSGKLTIFDSLGRTVSTIEIKQIETGIDTSSYPNGIYFASLDADKQHSVSKLVIQR